ncbi:MAG: geranylgeranylglyceryl/heptaprenylglyceryl phosphate synthase [Gemmatimonadaceae bacterium]
MGVLRGLAAGGGGLAVLVDPGRTSASDAEELARRAAGEGVVALLLGNSFGPPDEGAEFVGTLKRAAPALPLLQFPAMASQLLAGVDAVLFLSLVSGRNAQYLIEEHVRAVPFANRHPEVELISTAYCLVDGGTITSVESVSQTRPLPADKPELVAAHVRAALLIGMRAVYLDAGSGARRPVATACISAARRAIGAAGAPLLVGGGVRGPDAVRAARDAGADIVVVGSRIEQSGADAVHELAAAARA